MRGTIFISSIRRSNFYQLKGDIKVRVREGITLSIILCAMAKRFSSRDVPHSQQRPPTRLAWCGASPPAGEKEHVIFYCENWARW
jgi:hypothetical protein